LSEICHTCGLPKDLCVCDLLDKEETKRIKIYTAKAKFKKYVTIVEGLDKKQIKETLKELKRKLACGGSIKGEVVVLQGNQKKRVSEILVSFGFKKEAIEVS
jgi:translation initiation factor 1